MDNDKKTNVIVIDPDFNPVAVVDSYESFIWTDRYQTCGDFEFYSGVSDRLLDIFKLNRYVRIPNSERTMIVEQNKIASDPEKGAHMTVTGRSLEQILMRRIVQKTEVLNGNLQNEVHRLLDENIINPVDSDRRIPNFIFEESTDPLITNLTVLAEYTGNELYEILVNQCKEKKIGFKVILNSQNQFVFSLYAGVDRSYSQNSNQYVLFSPSYNNLSSSSFVNSVMNLKTVALVGGEGKSEERKYETVGEGSGLNRREVFIDASDLAQTVQTGDTEISYTDAEYQQMLVNRGSEELAKTVEGDGFEAEADTDIKYKYGRDFYIGDIVQLADEYGNFLSARVSERIFSHDESGMRTYPTFTSLHEED